MLRAPCDTAVLSILAPPTTLTQVDERVHTDFWEPTFWKRSNMVLHACWLVFLMTVVVEFSYSDFFATNQYICIAGYHVLVVILALFLETYVCELLLIAPLEVFMAITEILITMGANSFSDFVIAYFIGMAITTVERIYVAPALSQFLARVPK
jgi:hypothetical protein